MIGGVHSILSLTQDHRGDIWIGTFEGGVSVYDPETGEIRRFADAPGTSPWIERVRAATIREDHQGRIWVGTYGDGLLVIEPNQGLVHQLLHDPNKFDGLSSNTVYSLHADAQNSLWVGTGGRQHRPTLATEQQWSDAPEPKNPIDPHLSRQPRCLK
ncbi:MAG: ligand-binding sensor domain-containing protein [Halioglobus sp.]